ncbi:Frizzled-10 [Manis pentadactyla]|nr:Frizzled-10 [Manis pentadactyla]
MLEDMILLKEQRNMLEFHKSWKELGVITQDQTSETSPSAKIGAAYPGPVVQDPEEKGAHCAPLCAPWGRDIEERRNETAAL